MKLITHKEVVWDGSIRVFHWLFAASVSTALVIGLTVDDDSQLFEWHMLAGLVAGFLLLVRLVLLVEGSHPVNWRGLLKALQKAPVFVRRFFTKEVDAEAGHNPMAWLVYLLMFGQLLANYKKGAGQIELPWFQMTVPLDEDGFDKHGKAEKERHHEKDDDDDHDD